MTQGKLGSQVTLPAPPDDIWYIWELRADLTKPPWKTDDWTQDRCLITAETEEEARIIAGMDAGAEGKESWMDMDLVVCTQLGRSFETRSYSMMSEQTGGE